MNGGDGVAGTHARRRTTHRYNPPQSSPSSSEPSNPTYFTSNCAKRGHARGGGGVSQSDNQAITGNNQPPRLTKNSRSDSLQRNFHVGVWRSKEYTWTNRQ